MTISLSSPLMELLRSQTHHGPFPPAILQGMQSNSGANLQSVQQLDTFIERFFILNLPKNFFIQMAVAGSWIAILIILGSSVILHRIKKKAFWLFKFQRRSEGIYIVPNALNTFLVFEGLFGIVWIAFIIVQYRGYWAKVPSIQYHIGVFTLIIWWPLWIGAFMAGWGSFYTAPGALDKGPLSSSRVGKFAPRPLIINTFCLGTPVVLILSLIAPIVLTQQHFNIAFDAYRSFHHDLFESIASSPNQTLSPNLSQQYLERASQVWDMQAKSAWYQSIGYGIWPLWAGLFLIFYLPAGGYLCYMVWNQLRRQRAMLITLELKKREMDVQEKANREQREGEAMQREHSEALLFQPLSPSQEQQQQQQNHQLQHEQGGSGDEERPTSEPTDNSGGEIFFPPLRPELRKKAIKRISVTGTPRVRYNYLRRCFINLTILYFGIVLGAALYLGISASLAASLYESYLHDPQHCTDLIYNCCVVAAWGAVVFGSLTFFAILARLADPANTRDDEPKKKKPSQPSRFLPFRVPSSQGQSRTLTDEQQQQQQEKSRTMPAVPESVGGTFDDPLQSNATYSSIPSKSLRRGLKGGIKFNIQRKQGGLILRPDDMSFGGVGVGSIVEEESHTLSRRSYRSGSLVYHPTAHGDMPCPAPPMPKPLAPERSPPVSPIRLEHESTSNNHHEHHQPQLSIYEPSPRRRHSEWEIQQHHLPPPRRASEAGLRRHRHDVMAANGGGYLRSPPPSASLFRSDYSPTFHGLHLNSRRTSSAGFPEASPPPTGPVPPTPSTASTANFPITPVYHSRALPEPSTYIPSSPKRSNIALLNFEAPPSFQKRQGSFDPVYPPTSAQYPPMGFETDEVNKVSPARRFSPGVFF